MALLFEYLLIGLLSAVPMWFGLLVVLQMAGPLSRFRNHQQSVVILILACEMVAAAMWFFRMVAAR
jgi:hypothetical protein